VHADRQGLENSADPQAYALHAKNMLPHPAPSSSWREKVIWRRYTTIKLVAAIGSIDQYWNLGLPFDEPTTL
jgi:hypothetical protein